MAPITTAPMTVEPSAAPTTTATTATTATTTIERLNIPPELATFGTETVSVGGVTWLVAVADTPDERFQGLRRVADLGSLDGMIFVWEQGIDTSFTMRTVPIPLEIGFFDQSGVLFEVVPMEPCADRDDCPLYGSSAPFWSAIERPAGGWDGVAIGSLLVREN